ncbi:TonB-dependent siderophore receptor [Azorhizobium doebereinerae]|uniref:TonB-dependent siderophore receptor n=1 Tax=Azorhizobium doebereinerae TaxID=281091 RepID=UPI0003FBC6BB|nr:TonB-dependent siderophore receptor [Azorhizobium doebereinerae]
MWHPQSLRSLLLLGVAASGLMSGAAHAQQAAAPSSLVILDTVNVETDKETPTGPVEGYVAHQTVTGSKTATPIVEVPQSISVVTRDQMDDRAVQNLGQALDYSAGVVSQPFGTDPRFDSPIIRGFSAANSQYLNGLKLMRDQGMTSIDPYALERIDVLRGPSSVLYGQGNPGGLINMVSKRPTWTNFGEFNLEAATYDRYTASFDFGGPTAKDSNVAYRITGLGRLADTQTDYVENDRFLFAPSLTFRPDASTELTVLAMVQYDTPDSTVGLPNQYTLQSLNGLRASRSLYLGDPDFNASSRTLSTLGYEFSHTFDNNVTFRQNARYLKLNWDYSSLYYSGLDSTNALIANRGTQYNTEDLGTFTIDNQLEAHLNTGPLSHDILVGLDFRSHDADTYTAFGTAPSINIFAPVYGMTIPNTVWYASKVDGTVDQLGLYAQDQIKLEKWLLTLGIRQDWASVNSTTVTNYGTTTQDQDDSATTGRIGLTYLFDNGIAPYVSYSTSFEPVIGNMPTQLGGAAFQPSEGKQYEAGVKYQPVGWDGFFTAAVYDLKQSNVSSTDVIGGVSYAVQNGEVHVKGVELSATMSITQGLKLIANYTYMNAEITQGQYAGNRPSNVPENSANAWLDYTWQDGPLKGFGLGGGVRYVGERYDLDSNANLLPANTLFDAAIHYEKGPYKAQLNIANIADETYVATCGSFGCYYGDGRTITGKVTYRW